MKLPNDLKRNPYSISKLKERWGNIREKYRNIKEIYRNIISTFLIALITLFSGLLITYIIFHLIPEDPIEALLPQHYTQEMYNAMANVLGFEYNQLLGVYILRFSKFLSDFFSGAWGRSSSLARGVPVTDIILANNTILYVILLCIIPLIIGTFFMIKKSRRKSIVFNSLVITLLFSAVFIFYVMFSVLFNIRGFGKLLVDAIGVNDHYLITGCLFLVVIMYLSVPLTSNVIFSIYKLRSSKSIEQKVEPNINDVTNTK
ncbi:MAG: hypothetical protein ACFFBV_03805 [Promethearchaeota archaeon]